jgi:uncharacterized damage-inducible protein DinB
MKMNPTPLIETWLMSHEVNRYLLGNIPEDALGHAYDKRTRTVRQQFMHIHNVRLMWLKVAAPQMMGSLTSFDMESEPGLQEISSSLDVSAEVMERFLAESEAKGKVKGWKQSPMSFVGYLVAHEAHHRGLAIVCLRAGGVKLDKKEGFGMWEWGKLYTDRVN